MLCKGCNKQKLSREFPHDTVTAECDHPALYCLRCTVRSVEDHGKCPNEDCSQIVESDCEMMVQMRAVLESLFYTYAEQETPTISLDSIEGEGHIQIALMNGEKYQFPYRPDLRILDIKENLSTHFKHDRNKQRLMYNGKEIKTLKPGGFATLTDYNIQPLATIHLMVVLFAIPDDLNHVIFQLYWGIPPNVKCDFLDVTCFIYDQHHNCIDIVDYANEQSQNCGAAIFHSGDEMDRVRRIGSHRIEVKLKSLPTNVTHLFFTLSAWDSNSISKFKNPQLKIFDASNIFQHLCQKSLSDSSASQAVVVCCVYRVQDRWTIFESGLQTQGNTDDYSCIKTAIESSVIDMCI